MAEEIGIEYSMLFAHWLLKFSCSRPEGKATPQCQTTLKALSGPDYSLKETQGNSNEASRIKSFLE